MPSVKSLRVLRGREKKFEICGFHARKLLKTLGAFLQFPIFSHDRVSVVKQGVLPLQSHCLNCRS